MVREIHTWWKIEKWSSNFAANGTFHSEKALREMPNLPTDECDAIVSNSHTITWQITSKTIYWKPEYDFSSAHSVEDGEQQQREVENDEVIKQPKAKKAKKARTEEIEGEAQGEPQEDETPKLPPPPTPVTEGQNKRLTGMIPKLEEKLYDLSQAIMNVAAPDMEGVVSKNVIDRATEAQREFTGKVERVETYP